MIGTQLILLRCILILAHVFALATAPQVTAAESERCTDLKEAVLIQNQVDAGQMVSVRAGDEFELPVDITIRNPAALGRWKGIVTILFSLKNDIPGSAMMSQLVKLQWFGESKMPPRRLVFKAGKAMSGTYKLNATINAFASAGDSQHRLCTFDVLSPNVILFVKNDSGLVDILPPLVSKMAMDKSKYQPTDDAFVTVSFSDAHRLCGFERACPMAEISPWIAFVDWNGDRARTVRLQATGAEVIGEGLSRQLKYRIRLSRAKPAFKNGTYAIYLFPLTDEFNNISAVLPKDAQPIFGIENNP